MSNVLLDTSVDGGNNGAANNHLEFNVTVGNNPQRVMWIYFDGDVLGGANDLNQVLVDGHAATTVQTNTTGAAANDRYQYVAGILAPTIGTIQVSIQFVSTHLIQGGASVFYNVKQSLAGLTIVKQTSSTGVTSKTTSITTPSDNCRVFLFETSYNGGNPPGAGTGSTRISFDPTNGSTGAFWTNANITPAGSTSMQTTRTSTTGVLSIMHILIAMEQYVAPPPANAYRHARAGVCEAGTAISGLVPYRLRCTIAGVERGMQIQGFAITHTVGQPSSCTVRTTGFAVTKGQEIRISDDGAENLLFGGTIMKRRRRIQSSEIVLYELLCADWTWLLNKTVRIYDDFDNVGANVAVRRVLAQCDPALGMRAGNIPQALGNVTVSCAGDAPTDAVGRIAKAVNAYYRITPRKSLDLFQTEPPHGQTLLLHDEGGGVKNLVVEDFLDQVRNRVWYAGGGAQTSALATLSATTILVQECGWYSASGGAALADGILITYTGRSVDSGPGALTGVSGLTRELPQGASVQVLVKIDDAGRQAALASILGGGLSGVSIYYQADSRLSLEEVTGRADQHLDFYGDPIDQVTCTIDDHIAGQREFEAGRLVDVDIVDAEGETTGGTFRIASVVIRGRQEAFDPDLAYGHRSLSIERDLTLRPGVRQGIVDLLVNA